MAYRQKRVQLNKSQNQSQIKKAAALGYEPGVDEAPVLLAKGQEKLAQRIIELAQELEIPIQEDPVLVSALTTLELNQSIPPELYAVVAEVLAYVYRIQHRVLTQSAED